MSDSLTCFNKLFIDLTLTGIIYWNLHVPDIYRIWIYLQQLVSFLICRINRWKVMLTLQSW